MKTTLLVTITVTDFSKRERRIHIGIATVEGILSLVMLAGSGVVLRKAHNHLKRFTTCPAKAGDSCHLESAAMENTMIWHPLSYVMQTEAVQRDIGLIQHMLRVGAQPWVPASAPLAQN